jgi:Orsellinic acid/F9775 biosynthesis cluster protein D
MTCQVAIVPTSLHGHLKKHQIALTDDQHSQLFKLIEKYQIIPDTTITVPLPLNAPVEGLTIVEEGHCCDMCNYCVPTFVTFRMHWSHAHPQDKTPAANSFHLGSIQTFFNPIGQCWFEVQRTIDLSDPFSLYLRHQVPKYKTATAVTIPPPTHEREIPPLLQVTGWHLHLADYITSKPKIRELLELVQPPSVHDSNLAGLGQLRGLVWEYMVDVRTKAHNSTIGTRCLLMECPRYV